MIQLKHLSTASILLFLICCRDVNRKIILQIPMRDGIKLETLLLLPSSGQTTDFPAVLVRTPYDKNSIENQYRYLRDDGFAVVLQDVRGRYGSEGNFEPFVNEGNDGYDAIEWIAQQSWCNGNVGMIGASYNGLAQFSAAAEKPPHLRTIIPNVAMVDPFIHGIFQNGIFVCNSLEWCAILEGVGTDKEIHGKNWGELLNHSPVSELDSVIFSRKLPYFQRWVTHDLKDQYWMQASTVEKISSIQIPVLIQSGWYDSELRSSKLAYNALKASGNKNVKLIIGPWGHTDVESNYYKNKFIGDAGDDISLKTEYLRWLTWWLKDDRKKIPNDSTVLLYALKANKWYKDTSYPLKIASETKLFLGYSNHPDEDSAKLMLTSQDTGEMPASYLYDPNDILKFTKSMFEQGEQNKYLELLAGRNDHLFYKSQQLKKDQIILGQISAVLYASSTAVDTDWFMVLVILDDRDKLEDFVSFGNLRARFRNTFTSAEFLIPDKIYRFDIDMNHYGLHVKKGRKIGVIVTSSWGYPMFGKNLNKGDNNQRNVVSTVAKQTIFHDELHKSYISIPIISE